MEAVKLAEHLPSAHGYRPPEVGRAAFLKYIRTKKIPVSVHYDYYCEYRVFII